MTQIKVNVVVSLKLRSYNIIMKGIIFLAFSLAIFSCSNVTLETEPLDIESIEDGKVLSTGDVFDIVIDKRSGSSLVNPTRTKVYITPISSSSRTSSTTGLIELDIDLNENPKPQFLITDSFEDGLYNLKIEVYDKEELISQKSIEFVVFSETLDVFVSAFHPSKGLYPNSKVILKSKIVLTSEIDPYLVWRYNNNIIKEGYLSRIGSEVIWDSMDHIGFNDIRLDIFPYKLNSNKIYSKYFTDFSILVNPLIKQLTPSDTLNSYSKYMLFNGNYIDEKNKDLSITKYGDIDPVLYGDFYGLKINNENRVVLDDSLFAVNEKGFKNISILADILFTESGGGSFLSSNIGNLKIDLSYGDETITSVLLSEGVEVSKVNISDIEAFTPIKINITLISENDTFRFYYYINGQLVHNEDIFVDSALLSNYISDNKSTVIGGNSTVFNTLAVYSKRNNIYPYNLEDMLGRSDSNLLLEGFNSLSLPLELEGDASINGEILTLELNSKLIYKDIIPVGRDFVTEIKVLPGSSLDISFSNSVSSSNFKVTEDFTLERKGNEVFLDGKRVKNWDNLYSDLTILSQGRSRVDSVTIRSRGH